MFPFLEPYLTSLWGPFRLLGSHVVLIGFGAAGAALLNGLLLPRFAAVLPRDRGRVHAENALSAQGKPTGTGFAFVLLTMPLLFLVLPFSAQLLEVTGCLVLCMLTGFLDDRSVSPWGEVRKGLLDLGVAVLASLALCQGQDYTLWLPLIKGSFEVPIWLFLPLASALLWLSINTTNCSDGVDGLAGALTLLSLFYLGGFLYAVVGHVDFSEYLLVPHNPSGAHWAILVYTSAGALAGYLWHNAKPSHMLMGDAGSRYLGLLVGLAVVAAGNPFLILVVAPVVLVNGGTGLVKLVLLRGFKRLGFDVTPPQQREQPDPVGDSNQHLLVQLLHRIRFPLHDHCRRRLGWSDSQVLMRFVLIQAFLIPLLLGIMVKVR